VTVVCWGRTWEVQASATSIHAGRVQLRDLNTGTYAWADWQDVGRGNSSDGCRRETEAETSQFLALR
jgi:hypothetical protein